MSKVEKETYHRLWIWIFLGIFDFTVWKCLDKFVTGLTLKFINLLEQNVFSGLNPIFPMEHNANNVLNITKLCINNFMAHISDLYSYMNMNMILP